MKKHLRKILKNRFSKNEEGMAAIEFALLFPALAILFFGLVDLTGYISAYRKATLAASIVSDLAAQSKNTITAANLDDYFKAAYMVTNYGSMSNAFIKVKLFDYRKQGTAIVQKWTHAGGGGSATCAEPSEAGLPNLMAGGNDIVATQICMTYNAYVGFGKKQYTINQTVYVRPRVSAALNCTSGCTVVTP